MNNWNYLYKINYEKKTPSTSNMIYTPMLNAEGNVMCMWFDETSDYHTNPGLTKDIADFFFAREMKYLQIFQKYSWAAKLLDIDEKNRKVYIEFNKETVNHIMFSDRTLEEECPTWREQLLTIMQDIKNEGFYKMALYPHCFYIKDGMLKAFDFYSCVEIENPYIERSKIEGMIGTDSTGRFNDATTDGLIDFSSFFKKTMQHLSNTWTENPFPEIYRQVYES